MQDPLQSTLDDHLPCQVPACQCRARAVSRGLRALTEAPSLPVGRAAPDTEDTLAVGAQPPGGRQRYRDNLPPRQPRE